MSGRSNKVAAHPAGGAADRRLLAEHVTTFAKGGKRMFFTIAMNANTFCNH
jgi:hypothetical protein